jgi:hypothetical protein
MLEHIYTKKDLKLHRKLFLNFLFNKFWYERFSIDRKLGKECIEFWNKEVTFSKLTKTRDWVFARFEYLRKNNYLLKEDRYINWKKYHFFKLNENRKPEQILAFSQ